MPAPQDVLTLCARALAEIAPTCCEAHQDEFKAEADADEDADLHPQVH